MNKILFELQQKEVSERPVMTDLEKLFNQLSEKQRGYFTLLKGDRRVIAISKYSIPNIGRVCITSNSLSTIIGLKPKIWDRLTQTEVDEIASKADNAQIRLYKELAIAQHPATEERIIDLVESVKITQAAQGNICFITVKQSSKETQTDVFTAYIELLKTESDKQEITLY